MTNNSITKFVIAPFDPEKQDHTAFSYGVEQVDNFFKKTANKLASADNTRVFVMTNTAGRVIGFYALNAHAIDYRDLPQKFAPSRPSHGSIPAAFFIDERRRHSLRRAWIGGDLLIDALIRITRAAENLGIAVVVLDGLNDGSQNLIDRRTALYARYGFRSLPSNPLRMFLPVETIRMPMAE